MNEENVGGVCVLATLSCSTLCDPKDCSPPGSSAHKFSRQEYWSGLPYPPPRVLQDPGVELGFPALQADSLPSEPPGKLYIHKMEEYSVIKEILPFTMT